VRDCTVSVKFKRSGEEGGTQRAEAVPTLSSLTLLVMSGLILVLGVLNLRGRTF